MYEYLVLGAGPAGLQLGYFFKNLGLDYQILEGGEVVGNFFQRFPRQRRLISINKVVTGFDDPELNLRWDWNSLLNDQLKFTDYSSKYFPPADELVRYLGDFTETFDLNVRTSFRVTKVTRGQEGGFQVTGECGTVLQCRFLVVATGLSKQHIPDFPGAELCEDYGSVSMDPQDFHGQRVLILGKGNSALETADNLIETTASVHLCSPQPVKLAWNTHFVGNVRALNNNFLDTYQLKSQNVVLDAWVERIERAENGGLICHILYTHAKGERRSIPFDRAIIATGFDFDASIFDEDCTPELAFDGKLPNMNTHWESVNVPGMYFAGTLMQMRDFKKTMSGFIHGFRHNIGALANILAEKNHLRPWRGPIAYRENTEVVEWVIDRLNRSASMFLQPGFFGDVLVVHEDGELEFLIDVPLQFLPDWERMAKATYYTISLEYGDYTHITDSFAIDRDPDPANAHLIEYLHPIIRKYQDRQCTGEHHLVEDLENEYDKEQYRQNLAKFFDEELAPASAV